MTMTTAKGYKVTDAARKTRVGIAVKSLEDLKKKTIDKFKLPHADINFQTPDGTLVESDEYFQTLPPQTLLIWVKRGERAETDAELLYKTIREVNEEYLSAGEKVQEFFTEKMKTKVFKLAEVLKGIDSDKVALSSREEHPEWFEGLDTRSKSKEDYMFRRAQDRIRTYYYKTREDLHHHNRHLPPHQLNRLLADLQSKLKLNRYHGHLFDRRAAPSENQPPLCDHAGLFRCMGRWDKVKCLYEPPHRINPYASREERIVFQTWNLDHQIERSRSIVPVICEGLGQEACLDVKRIYEDLFTPRNMKFVHIVCHDKGAHSTKKAESYLIC
ncbi:DNA fragmentation factor subunit beta isoform X1 [Anthonomus grandis grandis]|uniref:DNA fragmentation factor subunit beta isoform X1 n=1 Tax=Anthonomus grandis grandis TaxID=2921223 RepID=UPI002164F9AA|nr:DNA fragmentation factor subunit beta isoform X1 [Anthonomus grandis grandis]XP_050311125.1 DNA fragmentation factor subunit beta isoform X1 [Anthonomus grandis grandis]XP_050311126.1 DNA fragmentation factor subunit beta isoform X1 [Anthonomus grandis grandis]XP_050311127.1 DNA fragmentation factor subunit beta isoform X1 [Anthonomus grandis grandis]XP_050311128.1 DNA fragmentation factor subunit beta isoform X1 [Anthonomus grandis grandis]XP_050311129.1 DNA fragmentation factor subunit be